MSSFVGDWWTKQRPTLQIAGQLRAIGELKGKAALYEHQTPQILETLRQAAIIQSIESSNRIEGITVARERLPILARADGIPQDRSEAELAGYRDVLQTIHTAAHTIAVRPGVVLQLHRDLFAQTETAGGAWKSSDNIIGERRSDGTGALRFAPVPAFATAEAMDQLCLGYRTLVGEVEPLLLIPIFVLDFLCIHPFLDGNGRMARLLTLLLLYQHGYQIGRFISLERVIEDSRDGYYAALYQSSQGWHAASHDPNPWWSYWLGTMLVAYREFTERADVLINRRGAKTALVLDAIRRIPGDFTIAELRRMVPGVGDDLLRRILRTEKTANRIERVGEGPAARWRRI
ncbi:MAG: Fic family protein [Thermomicrobiales bacterium]